MSLEEKQEMTGLEPENSVEDTASEQESCLDEEIDRNIEKDVTERLVSQGGVVADKFDELPQSEQSEEPDEFEGKECVRVQYGFHGDEVKKGLQIFQKKTLYKKNIIYSLIIGVLFLLYLVQVIQDPSSGIAIFICVLTVAVMGMIWYFPLSHIKQTVKAIDSQEYKEEYILSVYDNAVVMGEGSEKNVFYYQDNKIKAWELSDMYVIAYQAVRIFVVPKRCCEGKEEAISALLRDGLGSNYEFLAG